MKKVLVFNGSPRRNGNTSILCRKFADAAIEQGASIEILNTNDLDLNYCTGCLRCNMIGRCGQRGDSWEVYASKIDEADVLVFASPVYFHHVTASMKNLIDRFRSMVHVTITEKGLIHKPVKTWSKEVVIIFTMGSPDSVDAGPAEEMFRFIFSFLVPDKAMYALKATRLAVPGQILRSRDELFQLYGKMNIPQHLADEDYKNNQAMMEHCYSLGKKLASPYE